MFPTFSEWVYVAVCGSRICPIGDKGREERRTEARFSFRTGRPCVRRLSAYRTRAPRRAYRTDDPESDDPPALAFYCPAWLRSTMEVFRDLNERIEEVQLSHHG